jgi:Na+/proline symporter
MIYRVVNPNLEGFANEGAYLLMCKEVLPQGMLGLMLGAMVFATASSVNTTLNISAGVLTNDIFKKIFRQSKDRTTMIFARSATVVFGVLTIIVALMVPKMGGIVEVVLSVGAITGGPLFLPPIWAMFSKRQNARSIFGVTIISMAVNIFFKFISPEVMNLNLTRGMEMIVGASLPAFLLLITEAYLYFTKSVKTQYRMDYEISKEKCIINPKETKNDQSDQANLYGRKIIATGILVIGFLIVGLSLIADFGQLLISSMGGIICVLALMIWPWFSTRLSFYNRKQNKL